MKKETPIAGISDLKISLQESKIIILSNIPVNRRLFLSFSEIVSEILMAKKYPPIVVNKRIKGESIWVHK